MFDPRTVIPCPFTVLVDSREQQPYPFAEIDADAISVYQVPTVRRALVAGDYSVAGWEKSIAVERKSLCDLFATVGQTDRRRRFERELAKLAEMPHAFVVVEGTREMIAAGVPSSQLPGEQCLRLMKGLKEKYPSVRWQAAPDRRIAEMHTFKLLRRTVAQLEAEIAI